MWWGALAFALALLPGTVGAATTPNKQLTNVDLIQYAGAGNSVAVMVLNYTPYEIEYDSSSMDGTDSLTTNRDRMEKKSFMFAPVGVPSSMPPIGTKWDSTHQFLDASPDASYHPYSFVLSWDDRNKMIEQTSTLWKVRNVCYPSIEECTTKADVRLGMFFVRQDPKPNLKSFFFGMIADVVKLGLTTAGLVASGGTSKYLWVHEIMAVGELAGGPLAFAIQNTKEDQGPRMYVSAMPIPGCPSACCNGIGPGCMPSYSNMNACDSSALPDDGAGVQWSTASGGNVPSRLFVTTQLLRGKSEERDVKIGTLPIVTVVIWDAEWYQAAFDAWQIENPCQPTSATRKITSLLRQRGQKGLLQLSHLTRSLDPQQRQVFEKVLRATHGKHPLTKEQKQYLEEFATAFQQGKTTLQPKTPAPAKGGGTHGH
jgi:hypothetical protein